MPRNQITIGHLTFPSKAAAERFFRAILSRTDDFIPLEGQDRVDVETLLCNHEHAEEKIGSGILGILVLPLVENNTRCFHVYRTDSTIDHFSYHRAIEGQTPPRIRFMQAARAAVEQDVESFKTQYFAQHADADGRIALLGTNQLYTRREVHVDHGTPSFRAIADEFLSHEGLNPANIEYDGANLVGTRFRDPLVSGRLRDFHNARAVLKIVPAIINLRNAWLARADRTHR